MADNLDQLRELFPQLLFLVNDPEVGKLIKEAVDPNKGYSANQFEARLQATKWFRTQSNTQREWLLLRNNNPGEASQQRTQFRRALDAIAARMGVRLTTNERNLFAENYIQRGMSPDDPLIAQDLGHFAGIRGAYKNGDITTAAHEVDRQFKSQWLNMGMKYNVDSGNHVVTGKVSMETLAEQARTKAAEKYWWLKPQLEKGMTMDEIFEPIRQTIAEELEVAPESINLRDRRWSKLIHVADSKTGEHRMGTLYEAQTLARQQPQWWRTKGGRATDAGLQEQVRNIFGIRSTRGRVA